MGSLVHGRERKMRKTINLQDIYGGGTAKIDKLEKYAFLACQIAGEGNEIILTGAAPVWMYLGIAHALHGRAKRLFYASPVTGEVLIFDHDPH